MAIKKVYIGSNVGPLLYDDANPINDPDGDFAGENNVAIATTGRMIAEEAPVGGNDVLRLDDIPGIISDSWPVGSVFLSVVSTNPNTLLGFGTWSQIAQGQFLVGFKTADADFDPVENTGGAKTHDHPSKTSGTPSATETVDNNADGSTVAVGSGTHTHDVDPDAISHLPPFYVVYVWKRTA